MKKFSSLFIKVGIATALVVQLAFASDAPTSDSALAEPLYLTLCGVILLVFGMLKNQKDERDS